jgi:hypothetical protein
MRKKNMFYATIISAGVVIAVVFTFFVLPLSKTPVVDKHFFVSGKVLSVSNDGITLSNENYLFPLEDIKQFQQQLEKAMTEKKFIRINYIRRETGNILINKITFLE